MEDCELNNAIRAHMTSPVDTVINKSEKKSISTDDRLSAEFIDSGTYGATVKLYIGNKTDGTEVIVLDDYTYKRFGVVFYLKDFDKNDTFITITSEIFD